MISNIITGYGFLRLSENQFFLLGEDANGYNLRMLKITFSATSVDWINIMACSTSV